jgi:hypothetical protein
MKRDKRQLIVIAVVGALISFGIASPLAAKEGAKDIRNLSQHFTDPDGKMTPWEFYPKENISTITSTSHRGLLAIRDAGKGKDIKGVLKDPIKINDFPLPWEFKMGMLQPEPKAEKAQVNYAIGLNLVVTFSDPSTWPKDHSSMPPDCRSLQLFVLRAGSYGEVDRRGVPQLRYSPLSYGDPSPETYRLYGRGDLGSNLTGDWNIPYMWVGYEPPELGQLGAAANWSWAKMGGPAESNGLQDIRFRVRVISPTKLEVGFASGYRVGWRMRTVDVSHIGNITGIWEVGPIISLDRWLADEWAPTLGIQPTPILSDPNPESAYYIDYLDFFGNGPENFEHMSDEFDIPGLPADEKWFNEGLAMVETWSNPGYMTVTFCGKAGGWAMCPAIDGQNTAGLGYIELSKFPPPLEMEIAIIARDDTIAWNFWHSFSLIDTEGKTHSWSPGIQNIPDKGRIYINEHPNEAFVVVQNPDVNVVFKSEIPAEVLYHEPLRILLQIIDSHHIRVGLRGDEAQPWTLSEIFETPWTIQKFQLPCAVSFPGQEGSGVGNYPHFQQFLVDYVRYRHDLSQ